MERENFDFSTIIGIIKKNIKVFIVVIIAAAALAVVFSGPYFLKPLYKSVAVVYPINIHPYSDESETEQLLQVFQAGAIRDTLIEKFELYKRYEIAEGAPASRFYMQLEYNNRVLSSKTSYESVLLEVFDENPETAKLMADEVLYQLNLKFREFSNKRGLDRSAAFKKQMDYQLAIIDSVQHQIQLLSEEKGLVQYESQARELVKGYIDSYGVNPNSERTKQMRKWLDDLQGYGSILQSLQNVSLYATEQYGEISFKYLEWRAIGYEEVSYLDIVVSPETADKKVWPVRWLILVLSVGIASLITLIVLAARKKY